jgi:DNA invertase Pin-like site-specific DNA recombinase
MKAAVYVRVSREDEDPENQKYVVRRYCEENNLDCIFFPPEIGVARTEDPFQRPVLNQLLRFMDENNIKILITESVDRLIAEPEYWEKFLEYCTSKGIRLIFVRDSKMTETIESAVKTLEELRSKADSAVYKTVLKHLMQNLMNLIDLYFDVKVAVAKEYVEDVRYKVKRKLQQLRDEGKVYTKPTLIHWMALFLSGKERFSDLTKEEIEYAKRIFCERYCKPFKTGVPARRLYRKFLNEEKELISFIQSKTEGKKNKYNSYVSFYRLLKKLSSTM